MITAAPTTQTCNIENPLDAFQRQATSKTGHACRHKDCVGGGSRSSCSAQGHAGKLDQAVCLVGCRKLFGPASFRACRPLRSYARLRGLLQHVERPRHEGEQRQIVDVRYDDDDVRFRASNLQNQRLDLADHAAAHPVVFCDLPVQERPPLPYPTPTRR